MAFLLEHVPQLIDVNSETSTKAIIEAIKQKYGQEIAIRQAQKVKARLVSKPRSPCSSCGQFHENNNTCSTRSESRQDLEEIHSNEINNDMSLPEDHLGNDVSHAVALVERRTIPTSMPISTSSVATSALALPAISKGCGQAPGERSARNSQGTVRRVPISQPSQPSYSAASVGQPQRTGNDGNSSAGDRPQPSGNSQAPSKTPQEVRMEAARLMQNAARLMQEAARLNAEAARLTASVANV